MTILPGRDVSDAAAVPRRLSRKPTGPDAVFVHTSRLVGASVLAITGGIGLFLALQALPTLRHYGLSFFTETEWSPENDQIGIASVLLGTVQIAAVAMVIAFPLAFATALYISEYAPPRLQAIMVSAVDLMAAVPSIVYGLWGFFLIMPHAAELARWLQQNFGWIPIFDVKGSDPDAAVWDASRYASSAFCAGIAVSMMVMPMACAVMRQVFSQTPPGEKEAALALGATQWGMIRSVVLPFGATAKATADTKVKSATAALTKAKKALKKAKGAAKKKAKKVVTSRTKALTTAKGVAAKAKTAAATAATGAAKAKTALAGATTAKAQAVTANEAAQAAKTAACNG